MHVAFSRPGWLPYLVFVKAIAIGTFLQGEMHSLVGSAEAMAKFCRHQTIPGTNRSLCVIATPPGYRWVFWVMVRQSFEIQAVRLMVDLEEGVIAFRSLGHEQRLPFDIRV